MIKNIPSRFFISLLLLLFAITLFPFFIDVNSFSIDDYYRFFFKLETGKLLENSIDSGRWFGAFIQNFIVKLTGISGFSPVFLAFVFLIIQWVFVSCLLVEQFELDYKKWQTPLLISLCFIHVSTTELLTFKVSVVNMAFSFVYLFAIGGWFLVKKFDYKFLIGSMLIMLTLATYQSFINILLVLSFVGIILKLLNDVQKKESFNLRYFINNEYFIKLISILFAVIVYLLINKFLLLFFNVNFTSRAEFVAFNEIPERLKNLMQLYIKILSEGDYFLIPHFTKTLILICIVSAVLTISYFILSIKTVRPLVKITSIIVTIIFLIVALLSSALTSSFLKEYWLMPRMFSGFGFFFMSVFIFLYKFSTNRHVLFIVSSFLCMIIFSFMSINHNVANEQNYLNQLDRNKAIQIVNELEKIKNYNKKRIYINQTSNCWYNHREYFRTGIGDLNLSAFCTSWSKYELLQYVSGEKYTRTSQAENEHLDSLYQAIPDTLKPRWPINGVLEVGDEVIAIYP